MNVDAQFRRAVHDVIDEREFASANAQRVYDALRRFDSSSAHDHIDAFVGVSLCIGPVRSLFDSLVSNGYTLCALRLASVCVDVTPSQLQQLYAALSSVCEEHCARDKTPAPQDCVPMWIRTFIDNTMDLDATMTFDDAMQCQDAYRHYTEWIKCDGITSCFSQNAFRRALKLYAMACNRSLFVSSGTLQARLRFRWRHRIDDDNVDRIDEVDDDAYEYDDFLVPNDHVEYASSDSEESVRPHRRKRLRRRNAGATFILDEAQESDS